MTHDFHDVLVLGGGPAGSTLASFLAMGGARVLLLERETFPRHQIGESLLPATVHGICRLLGIFDEFERQGFPKKNGGTFRWGRNPEPWTFRFSRRPDDPFGYAFQVERARFDQILLDRAKALGVDVREGHHAKSALVEDGRVVGVLYLDAEGRERTARARYVADASGNRSQLWRTVGERVYSEFFKNVALYGYFAGGRRLPAPDEGNILSAAFRDGWFWYIPLSDSLTSVGAVVGREAAEEIRRRGEEPALRGYIERCDIIADYLSAARRVTEGLYGALRLRSDYSYCMNRFSRPGMVLVGDAACFVDPVFSSGVHLGTYSALLAARSILTLLAGTPGISEEECFAEFEDRYRREFGRFYQFLVAFYDVQQDEQSYFWQARKILHTEERANAAFVRLGADDEPLFAPDAFFAAREGFGAWFSKNVLPPEAGDGTGPAAPVPPPARAAVVAESEAFNPAQFMHGFTREITALQILAVNRTLPGAERPVRAGGLVPSIDGFRWKRT